MRQRSYLDSLGLHYYVARWYDPVTAHFTQADSIIPSPGNSGDWDRYAYVLNNPMKYIDPSGHYPGEPPQIDTHIIDGDYYLHYLLTEFVPSIVPRKKSENGDGWGNYYTGQVDPQWPVQGDNRETLDPNDDFGGYYEYESALSDIYNTEVIHHVGAPGVPWNTPEEVEAHHMATLGWYDVGYHFLIGADGTIYEGRDIGARGSHVAYKNSGKVGIVLLANFDLVEPTDAQIQALTDLTIYLDYKLGIDNVNGHRDFNDNNPSSNTNCPGVNGYPLVDLMRQILEEK